MDDGSIQPVEKWEVPGRHGGEGFVCFRDARGELFYFQRGSLRRGKPFPPYKTLDELSRPLELVTIKSAARMSGVPEYYIKDAIYAAKIPAVKKKWRYGHVARSGWLVELKHVRELLARRLLERAKGEIEWDISASRVLRGSEPEG